MRKIHNLGCGMLVAVLLSGCAATKLHRDGMKLVQNGEPELGLNKLAAAVELAPTNMEYRKDLVVQRDDQVERLMRQGNASMSAEQWQAAQAAFERAHNVSPLDSRPADALELLSRARSVADLIERARVNLRHDDLAGARELLASALAADPSNAKAAALLNEEELKRRRDASEHPTLRSATGKSVTLHFTDASVRMILESISRLSGLAIILDQDIKPDATASISAEDVAAEDAVNFVAQTAHLHTKVLDPNTVFVFPATPEKIRDYEELLVKAFYLSNGDVKRAESLLKGFLKTDDIFVDEKKNLLIVRGPADTVHLAEKLIAMDDVMQPEVMLEVQVMEINRSRLNNLGIEYPNQATLSRLPSSGSATTLLDFKKINPSVIGLVIPNTVVNLSQVFTDADILANPRIRVKNRERAKILIGDKLPVVTSTATSTGFVSENIQYLDVGLKLDVEPDISVDENVSINLSLEVSSVVNQVTTPGGSLAYDIGTRDASTVLELKDGETEVLAGLISDNDTRTSTNIPGLGQFPIVGRLFSNHKTDHEKSEIVLLITPHIVRGYRPTVALDSSFWSGTLNHPRTEPFVLRHGARVPEHSSELVAVASASDAAGSPVPSVVKDALEPPRVSLTWRGEPEVKVGDVFKVSLHLDANVAVHGFPFQVLFDQQAVEVLQVEEGPYFKQGTGQSLFAFNVEQAAGRVVITSGQGGSLGVQSNEDVATLTLRAKTKQLHTALRVNSAGAVDTSNQDIKVGVPATFDFAIAEP